MIKVGELNKRGIEIIVGDRWRENTGVTPKFKGKVDVVFRDNDTYSSESTDAYYWYMDGRQSDIIKWRPSLEQDEIVPVDDKPVFTQAMADAGESPPVGSKCILCIDPYALADDESKANSGKAVSIIAHHDGLIVCTLAVNENSGWVRMFNDQAFRPIPLEREIAIEAMGKVCAMAHGEKELFEALYDAGYRKEGRSNA